MKVTEHNPPEFPRISDGKLAVFLAGPIQGAPDWQSRAIETIREFPHIPDLEVFNPRLKQIDRSFNKKRQMKWEKAGLRRAARFGVVIFWFAKRDYSLPHDEGRCYAQTSRIELGRVAGWKDFRPKLGLQIGIEPGYEGNIDYITDCAEEFNLKVHDSLHGVCWSAIKNIRHL